MFETIVFVLESRGAYVIIAFHNVEDVKQKLLAKKVKHGKALAKVKKNPF